LIATTRNYIAVKKDGKWGVVDIANKIVLPFEYTSISSIGRTTGWVNKNENESSYEINLVTKQNITK
jgi:hypothetical protein